tara:strand:+ start:94 stop:3171 length:3078 start_codon:yes stop_codon:yes gene_type:complete
MALDVSKISLQGVGVLNANATIVAGSGPSTSHNVTVTASSVNSKWTTDGVTLENVTSVSGESTFLITSKPGFQISSSFFLYDPDPTETSTLISNVIFTNTTNNFDPNNQVLVTISWITQTISSDTDIVLNNIQIQQPVAGNFPHNLKIIVAHESSVDPNIDLLYDFSESFQSEVGGEEGYNEPNQFKTFRIQGIVQEGETALVAIVNITPVNSSGSFASVPSCSVTYGNTNNYILETSFEYNKQVVKIYYTPSLEDYEDEIDDEIIITSNNYNEPNFIVQDLNNNEVSTFTVQNPSSTLQVKIIGVHAVLGSWHAYTHPYDGTDATWIPTITWDSNSATMSLTINQNTGVERQAVINLYTTYDNSTPLSSFNVIQSEDNVLDITITSVNNHLGSSLAPTFNNPQTESSVSFPVTGGTISLQSVIESYNEFSEDPSGVNYFLEPIEGDNNTDWFELNYQATNNNTFNLQYKVSPNSIYGNPAREASITVQHPIDSSITKSITVSQDRAYDPSIDTLTVYSVVNPTSITSNLGNLIYQTGTTANAAVVSVNADMSSYANPDLIIQMDFGSTALLGDPILQLRFIDDSGNDITNEINNNNNGLDEWLNIATPPTSIDDSGVSYNYFSILNIENNLSMTNTRSVVLDIYHPNSLIEDLTSVTATRSITITQSVSINAYFDWNNGNTHPINSNATSETFEYPIVASGGIPTVILEKTRYQTINVELAQEGEQSYSIEQYLHAGTPAGTSGQSGHLVNGFSVTSNAEENSYTLNVNILRNTIQQYVEGDALSKITQFFHIWPNGVTPGNYSPSSGGTYDVNNYDQLIVSRSPLHPDLIESSITPTGLMGSIATETGTLNPAGYSMSGQYNYITPDSSTSSIFYYNSVNITTPIVGVNLYNGHNLSNALSYTQSYSNNIVVVIGLVNIPSYQTVTIEPSTLVRRHFTVNDDLIDAASTVLESHITSYSIVSDTSGSAWSTTGDFSKYIKLNIAPVAQFTSGSALVHRIQHFFRIRVEDSTILTFALNTRTNY